MIDLSTSYMGLDLKHPIVPGSSPLSKKISGIKQLEDAGAPAVVLFSIFEEQLKNEADQLDDFLSSNADFNAEAQSFFPSYDDFETGPEEYLEHIRKAKEATDIPIIASLNGVSLSGWTSYAKQIQEAGANGLELNMYYMAADPGISGSQVEDRYVEVIKSIKNSVQIPVSIKLSPFFSSISNMAVKLNEAGANSLVLFNRFYQPEININEMAVEPRLVLSTSHDKYLPMRWIAILFEKIKGDLAASTGVHYTEDVVQMLMAGASITQVTSVLLEKKLSWISETTNNLSSWLEKHEYNSVKEIVGIMSQNKCNEPAAYERANYMKVLMSYS